MEPDEIENEVVDETNEVTGNEEEIEEKPSKRNEGIEKRIAELTAVGKDAERRAAAAEARAQQQTDLNMQLLARANAPTEPVEDPFEDVDPKVKKMFTEGLSRAQATFAAKLQAQQMNFEARLETQEIEHQAAVIGLDAESTAEAAKIVRNLKSQGFKVEKTEVLDMMIGKAVREGKYTPPASGTNPRRAAPLGSVRQPNLSTPEISQQKPLPSNFDDLSPEQQLTILEKRGAGNSRL